MQHRITLARAAKDFGLHHLLSMMKMLKQLRKWIFDQAERGVVAKHVEAFIREFFYQNPFSQVGLVTVKDGVAHCLTDLGGSPESHVKALMGKLECSGDSSLQNALDLVHGYLNQIPSYGHREMLILYSALSTCDPGDILETIQKCKKSKIRCSVIGLSAENSICKNLCQETGGLYYIPLDEPHLKELILEHAPPPPTIVLNFVNGIFIMRQSGTRDSKYICTRGKKIRLPIPP
ncbi:hypothetical protein ACFX2C_006521 [Malus domestica]